MFQVSELQVIRECVTSLSTNPAREYLSQKDRLAIERGEATAAERLSPYWYKIWQRPVLQNAAALGPFRWLIYPPQIRALKAERQEVRWHQDAGFVKAMARQHKRIITIFVPLDDNPSDRCTLQFTRETPGFLEHSPTSNGFAAGLSGEFTGLYSFDLELGDCLVFGDLAPHRSYTPPGCSWERASMEFRAVVPTEALKDKDYFDIDQARFTAVDRQSSLTL